MRQWIRLIDWYLALVEGDVRPFPGKSQPVNNLAVARGGADVIDFRTRQDIRNPFTNAYLVAALWSSHDEEAEPLDAKYAVKDIAPPTLKEMAEDCAEFQRDCDELLDEAYHHRGYGPEQAGHDFWLTRNRHGAGFWDRGLGEVGSRLSDAASHYGSYELSVGDDGMLYGE